MIGGEQIWIKPMSYGPEERIEASELATAVGKGLRMEVHSSHTEFYADKTVPVGKVAVYAAQEYKAWPTFETMLDSAEQYWVPFMWRTTDGEVGEVR